MVVRPDTFPYHHGAVKYGYAVPLIITLFLTRTAAAQDTEARNACWTVTTDIVIYQFGLSVRLRHGEMTVDNLRWKGRTVKRIRGRIRLKADGADWDPWHPYLCLYDPQEVKPGWEDAWRDGGRFRDTPVRYVKITDSANGAEAVLVDW